MSEYRETHNLLTKIYRRLRLVGSALGDFKEINFKQSISALRLCLNGFATT